MAVVSSLSELGKLLLSSQKQVEMNHNRTELDAGDSKSIIYILNATMNLGKLRVIILWIR